MYGEGIVLVHVVLGRSGLSGVVVVVGRRLVCQLVQVRTGLCRLESICSRCGLMAGGCRCQ